MSLIENRIAISFTWNIQTILWESFHNQLVKDFQYLLYSNRNVYENVQYVYDTALKGSGFHDNLYYAEHDDPTNENIKKGRENAILFDLNLLTR